MSGRDHISPQQFQLFDPGPAQNVPAKRKRGATDVLKEYEDVQWWTTPDDEENRIPDTLDGASFGPNDNEWEETNEFIPTERITSPQMYVNRNAVEHMVQHANPLALDEDPEVMEYQTGGETLYDVNNGNHRINAALRRGQLLIPANVYRPKR